ALLRQVVPSIPSFPGVRYQTMRAPPAPTSPQWTLLRFQSASRTLAHDFPSKLPCSPTTASRDSASGWHAALSCASSFPIRSTAAPASPARPSPRSTARQFACATVVRPPYRCRKQASSTAFARRILRPSQPAVHAAAAAADRFPAPSGIPQTPARLPAQNRSRGVSAHLPRRFPLPGIAAPPASPATSLLRMAFQSEAPHHRPPLHQGLSGARQFPPPAPLALRQLRIRLCPVVSRPPVPLSTCQETPQHAP